MSSLSLAACHSELSAACGTQDKCAANESPAAPPQPACCPGSAPLHSAVRFTADSLRPPAPPGRTLCNSALKLSAGIAAGGSKLKWRGKRQLHSWFTCFPKFDLRRDGKGNNGASAEQDFFCPELLKKAEWLGCKKRYDIKEKREMWLLFQNLVLNFHTDLIRQAPTGISGYLLNQEWSSWIRNCRLGIL